ncbi:hypothetical protein EG329_013865 [Mollisiaceae sp. DMI_Dod_QoI]|nr:hypothetical protein EG329_013865 [Helotiales sp. DMI_Dod_QoI]
MVPFGFGVGDFLAVAGLVWKLCQTLDEFSKDANDFRKVQLELLSFHSAILSIERLLSTNATLSEEQIEQLRSVYEGCQATIEEFREHAMKYKSSTMNGKGTRWLKRTQFAFVGRTKMEPFRRMVQSYSTSLTLIIAAANSTAVQDLGQEIQASQQGLVQQVRMGTEDIKLQISAALNEPWDQKPIRFQDAIGRRYPIPLEVCKTFQGLLAFLTFAFKDSPISNAIKNSDIWLFSPVKEGSKQWNLIWGEDWEEAAEPGLQLGMSLGRYSGYNRADTSQCIFDQEVFEREEAIVRFQTPLPNWSKYPDDAEFKFRSSRSLPLWLGNLKDATSIATQDGPSSRPGRLKEDASSVVTVDKTGPAFVGFDDVQTLAALGVDEKTEENLKPKVS